MDCCAAASGEGHSRNSVRKTSDCFANSATCSAAPAPTGGSHSRKGAVTLCVAGFVGFS